MRSLLRRIRRNPVRTLLTALQVALASFAITLSLSAYLTPTQTLADDTFYLVAGQQDENGSGQTYGVFAAADLRDLARNAPDVEALGIYEYAYRPEFSYGDKRFQFFEGATVSPEYFTLRGVEVIRGSTFSTSEAENQEAVVMISEGAAKIIFGDADPLGRDLLGVSEMSSATTSYRVIGVFADATGDEASTAPTVYYPVWAPGDTVVFSNTFAASTLIVRAKPGRSAEAGAQLLGAVRRHYRDHPQLAGLQAGRDFYLTEQSSSINLPEQFNPNLVILGLFGIITLIIGSIGVFSSTLVSLAERSHEIGIKRALGATGAAIGGEFGFETVLLTLISSVLGGVLAAALMPPLFGLLGGTSFLGTAVSWRPSAALIAVGVTVLSAALLGIGPAYRSGQLNPIVNLRE